MDGVSAKRQWRNVGSKGTKLVGSSALLAGPGPSPARVFRGMRRAASSRAHSVLRRLGDTFYRRISPHASMSPTVEWNARRHGSRRHYPGQGAALLSAAAHRREPSVPYLTRAEYGVLAGVESYARSSLGARPSTPRAALRSFCDDASA